MKVFCNAYDISHEAKIPHIKGFNEIIWVGATVRNLNDAFTLHGILEVNKNFKAGILFEVLLKSFSGANYGTYEIMLSYDLGAVGNRYF